MRPFQILAQLRRGGRTISERVAVARELIARHPQDRYLLEAAGWIVFDWLKLLRDRPGASIIEPLKFFKDLGLNGSSLVASLVLAEALKFKKDEALPSFCKFWFARFALREEDRQRLVLPNGKQCPSLEERFQNYVSKHAIRSEGSLAAWSWERTSDWIRSGKSGQWVIYNYAKGLLARGRHEEAAAYVCQVVLRNRSQFWAWSLLSELLLQFPYERLQVLRHAVALGPEPKYLGRIAVELVPMLVEQGRESEAAWILREVVAAYRGEGWQLPGPVQDCLAEPWSKLDGCGPAVEETTQPAELVLAAVGGYEILSGAVVEHQNSAKKLAWCEHESGAFPLPHAISGVKDLGASTRVMVIRDGSRIVAVHPQGHDVCSKPALPR